MPVVQVGGGVMSGYDVMELLLENEERLFLVGAIVVFGLWITVAAVVKVAVSMGQERTKREIAAYIAEGSMSPEQGERLIKSGKKAGGPCG